MENPQANEDARVARNKLIGRLLIIAMGLLVLIQVAPMIVRMARHQPL